MIIYNLTSKHCFLGRVCIGVEKTKTKEKIYENDLCHIAVVELLSTSSSFQYVITIIVIMIMIIIFSFGENRFHEYVIYGILEEPSILMTKHIVLEVRDFNPPDFYIYYGKCQFGTIIIKKC